ncbi:Endo-beta-mannanase [Actinoplanes sp. SE50]|uniref:cellulase family glycosylhydrolase n=1 Tax=unclassified Actinoplanes TaxID=2626549 RepID=UPI00023EC98F|nr:MULTISPECIES: cellulase family glycosylhydrolase [unclassified Actinoplanes]AEV84769.1 Endo-beta-mannanase [Actinoplanes sp. SE50/110]ATO83161.1 Endo-beta-mannanase [Actinoplanes sp. SE50]SLM00568.1 Endo-beta-mannanase [Actinoplanes sp. SE50/110]
MRLLRAATIVLTLVTSVFTVPSAAYATPPRQGFVTRAGAELRLNGKPFRFAGTNAYWLGLDENVGGIDYPTYFRIRDAIDTAKGMGMTVIRSHMLVSSGHPKTLLPSKETGYNDDAFKTIDYAIAYAGQAGIRLILPLTDNWAYYHGGHADFTKPYGLPDAAFYTDPRVIADYQAYVWHVMQHVNPLTGKRYIDDPTIMAWELGNELEGMTPEWIGANAATFAGWAPRQLIAAGRRFDIDPDTLGAAAVDIVDVHYYPPTAAKVQADAATVAAAGKVYIAGEYASTAAGSALLDPLVTDRNVTGMLSWSLFGHHDRSGFVQHDDGFTFHYPGDDARMTAANQAQIAYAKALGASIPKQPAGTPLITAIDKRGGLNVLQWRGAAGAAGYRVERAPTERGPWQPAYNGLLTDDDTPWTDLTAPGNAWYRVVAGNRRSQPQYVGATDTVLVDPLESFGLTSGHTGVEIHPGTDHATVRPTGNGPAWVSWQHAGTRKVRFDIAADRHHDLAIQVSDDGVIWRTVGSHADRDSVTAATAGSAHVRVLWTGRGRAGITGATFWAADPAPITGRPAAFGVTAPAAGATDVIGPEAFAWEPSAGAGYYTLTVSRHPDLSDPVLTATGLATTTHTPAHGLDPATTWYWSVRATNAAGSSSTPVASFATRALPSAPATIDDFEGYADSAALAAAYPRNTGGDVVTPTLIPASSGSGHAMQLDVTAGSSGYAGVSHTFTTPVDLWGQQGIELVLNRSATQASITLQFVANGVYWEHTLPAGTPSGVVRVPFTSFAQPPWAPSGALDLRKFTQLSIYLGGSDSGRLTVDNVSAYPAGQ